MLELSYTFVSHFRVDEFHRLKCWRPLKVHQPRVADLGVIKPDMREIGKSG